MWDQCATRSRAGHRAMLLNSEPVKALLDQEMFNKKKKRNEKQQFCHEINLSSLSHLRALCHRDHQAETQPGTSSASNKSASLYVLNVLNF